jgi:hypothetical protein
MWGVFCLAVTIIHQIWAESSKEKEISLHIHDAKSFIYVFTNFTMSA